MREMWSFTHDLRRLIKLIGREGSIVAFHKGARYLKTLIPARIGRFRMLHMARTEDRFTMIYRTNMWGARETVSGPASSLVNTERLRRELPSLFVKLGVKTIFDAPCGDFYWMQHVLRSYPLDYIGGDIVRPLIEDNNARFGNARQRFVHIDVSKDDVPKTDLWICRGLFSLLSHEDGLNTLRQFVRSGTPHILLSSHANPAGLANVDAKSGDFHYVDMFSAPFNLPRPILRLADRPDDEDICLWSLEQVADALRKRD